jgi:NAD(P)-dependent dehydrogenase (short-subunit alcohol dehydrogenase family)
MASIQSENMTKAESVPHNRWCEGKVAIVTGAAGSGIGRSIALTLAREGARVVVNYRTSQENAQAIVAHIENTDGSAIAVPGDVFTADGCKNLVDTAMEQYGRVDICIIGPGGDWHPEPIDQLVPDAALEDLRRETAPLLYLLPLVLPGMYVRKWGRLIGIATHPVKLSPAYAYNTGKLARIHALLLAQDQAWPHGVTVNVIAPGPVEALPSLEAAIEQCQHGEAWLKRPNVSPTDIAEGVSFLCSEAGRFISGCVLPYLFHW